ncbi:hypothetical protein BIWAKO_00803 [Bosea sp. BIWAKO-01]|nr:hypothetical protein BIWAKO_00803 [Bosea sp. BIWAKO-01]
MSKQVFLKPKRKGRMWKPAAPPNGFGIEVRHFRPANR